MSTTSQNSLKRKYERENTNLKPRGNKREIAVREKDFETDKLLNPHLYTVNAILERGRANIAAIQALPNNRAKVSHINHRDKQ